MNGKTQDKDFRQLSMFTIIAIFFCNRQMKMSSVIKENCHLSVIEEKPYSVYFDRLFREAGGSLSTILKQQIKPQSFSVLLIFE